ncbi:MAG: FadR family transcriptional regulator [Ruminococcus sp.]|nr:FadR family transcriptional regulator [Ruminococcus sp.]
MENLEFQKTLNYIFELIESGMVRIGDRLPTEREISAKLGVSRNFVREAIRSLEALGLVECRQGSGNYLTDNIKDSIAKAVNLMLLINKITREEVSSFRRTMDKSICNFLIQRGISPDNKQKITDALKKMEEADSSSEYIDADKELHYAMIYATENRLWITLLEAVSQTYRKWMDYCSMAADNEISQQLLGIHEQIVTGIFEKNIPACMNAIDAHYDITDDISI